MHFSKGKSFLFAYTKDVHREGCYILVAFSSNGMNHSLDGRGSSPMIHTYRTITSGQYLMAPPPAFLTTSWIGLAGMCLAVNP